MSSDFWFFFASVIKKKGRRIRVASSSGEGWVVVICLKQMTS